MYVNKWFPLNYPPRSQTLRFRSGHVAAPSFRERERERHIYIYIHIYTCTYMNIYIERDR